jgi:tRNA 2-thiouridine synthesizing protein C
VSLVFIDDGVYELVKGQKTTGIEVKNFSPMYRALDDYDINKLYVERESLQARGLSAEDLLVPVEVMDARQIGALMAQQDVVMSF